VTTRVALVTGGARGIGAATVAQLVGLDYGVVILDCPGTIAGLSYSLSTEEDLAALREEFGDSVATLAGDVRSLADQHEAVAMAKDRFGRLDVVVAAAGVATGGHSAWEHDTEQFNVNFDVNVLGVHRSAQAAIPALLANSEPRTARFIALASSAAVKGHDKLAAYAASKHAVAGYVKSLAADLGGSGVTANAVLPGSTRTKLLQACASFYGLEDVEAFAEHHLTGKLLEPAQVASVICFLASEDSGAMTGALVPADGGMTAH
jgi:SDR family mycofactocin-dependent oxidoreductase